MRVTGLKWWLSLPSSGLSVVVSRFIILSVEGYANPPLNSKLRPLLRRPPGIGSLWIRLPEPCRVLFVMGSRCMGLFRYWLRRSIEHCRPVPQNSMQVISLRNRIVAYAAVVPAVSVNLYPQQQVIPPLPDVKPLLEPQPNATTLSFNGQHRFPCRFATKSAFSWVDTPEMFCSVADKIWHYAGYGFNAAMVQTPTSGSAAVMMSAWSGIRCISITFLQAWAVLSVCNCVIKRPPVHSRCSGDEAQVKMRPNGFADNAGVAFCHFYFLRHSGITGRRIMGVIFFGCDQFCAQSNLKTGFATQSGD